MNRLLLVASIEKSRRWWHGARLVKAAQAIILGCEVDDFPGPLKRFGE
jgi:hypothetical protein